MDINVFLIILQFFYVLVAFISSIILFLTIKSNKELNKNNLFNELVKQEREVRIRLNEYQEKIDESKNKNELNRLWNDHDNLVFNF